MIQKILSEGKYEGGSNGEPPLICEPDLVRWYLDLEREKVLKGRKNAVYTDGRSS
jgi:hypothetical protein